MPELRLVYTVFIAPTYVQARYWAEHWGFQDGRWIYVASALECMGLELRGCEIYICGRGPMDDREEKRLTALFHTLHRGGATLIDAQADTDETRPGLFHWATSQYPLTN